MRDSTAEKELQADTLEAEAEQLLADAAQARQDAEALRVEADELIALAEAAEAQAAEYRELAENPPQTQEATLFVYNQNGQLIGEYTETGETVREYVYFNGQPLALIESQGEVYYVHTDHLGTPGKMTDQNQQVVWEARYNPFGAATIDEDPDGDGNVVTNNRRFAGQYFDSETGFHYNHWRYYNPETGRYITSDPIGITKDYSNPQIQLIYGEQNTSTLTGLDSINSPYGYAKQNPLKYVDVDGLNPLLHCVRNAKACAAAAKAAQKAMSKAIDKCKKIRCKLEVHDAHHKFGPPFNKRLPHIQLTCWIKGQKGSTKIVRIPLPESMGPN